MATLRILTRTNPISFITKVIKYSTLSKKFEYLKCCKILGVPEGSDHEEIRQAYLELVKKYHPDSGGKEANADKFAEIDKAFKTLITHKSRERWGVEDAESVQEQDINHTAPQHRQYLSYGGMGTGTPFQREKQYAKIRAMQAADNVLKHRVAKVTAEDGALLAKTPLKHKIKTKYGFDRLVEDLIQESMSKGEFSNLSGVGKPLKSHDARNPYVDFITHKLNEVLIDNGFTPEWITLQKEIREEIQLLKNSLLSERTYFGEYPLKDDNERIDWLNTCLKYRKSVDEINERIDKFNLVVPILDKQMIQISLQREGEKALVHGKNCHEVDHSQHSKKIPQEVNPAPGNIFGFIEQLFKK